MNGKEDVAYVSNGILLSHKKDKNLPFATILVDLKDIMPNEINQMEKANMLWFHSYLGH